jgi:hypothetical protein
VQPGTGVGTEADDVACVRWDFGLVQDDIDHRLVQHVNIADKRLYPTRFQ